MELLKTKSAVRILVLALLITMIVWLLPTNVPQASAKSYPQGPTLSKDNVVTWDCIQFGRYPQRSDDHGGFYLDGIKWRVLSVDGDDAFLLADQNLDAINYNETYTDIIWEKCTLRSWLNGYDSSYNQEGKDYTSHNFIDVAFFKEEKAAINETEVVNSSIFHKDDENTMDKVFLLSEVEASKEIYGFPDHVNQTLTREAKNTDYTIAKGINNYKGSGWWWLRTAGRYTGHVKEIGTDGSIKQFGMVDDNDHGVRPALHLDLSSNVWYDVGTVRSDGKVHVNDTSVTLTKGSTYTGKTQKPPVVVKSEDATLKKDVDYTLDYENNVNIGTGEIKIQGIGNYTGNVTKTFAINPAKASLTSVKAKGKALSTIVKQQKGGVKYEFSYKANGGKYKVLNTKESKVTFKNLKKGTTYSVRVRAYKIVDGKKFYGDYSAVKKVKVK